MAKLIPNMELLQVLTFDLYNYLVSFALLLFIIYCPLEVVSNITVGGFTSSNLTPSRENVHSTVGIPGIPWGDF